MNDDASNTAALHETAALLRQRANELIKELRVELGNPQREFTAPDEEIVEEWNNSSIAIDMQRQLKTLEQTPQGKSETHTFLKQRNAELSRQVELLERVKFQLKKSGQ